MSSSASSRVKPHRSPHGHRHWILQRFSAAVLVVPLIYLITALLGEQWVTVEDARNWFLQPLPRWMSIVALVAGYTHAALGIQVVLEDYIPAQVLQSVVVMIVWGVCAVLGIATVMVLLML